MGENFQLKPGEQCTKTDTGHFGEAYKEVFQGGSGLLAREQTWDQNKWSALQNEVMFRSDRDGGRIDPGPYNKNFIDMAFHGDVYSMGTDTKTIEKDGKPLPTGSAEYSDAKGKMDTALKSINFDAPPCPGLQKGVYENLDQKGGS